MKNRAEFRGGNRQSSKAPRRHAYKHFPKGFSRSANSGTNARENEGEQVAAQKKWKVVRPDEA
jgi:hypothetical protein